MAQGGGAIDSLTGLFKTFGAEKEAKRSAERARGNQRDNMNLLQSQQHNPELVSRHIGPYKRSQSPVADAFLESMLTGQNAGAVQGTRAGASGQRRNAQQGFDASTGGFDALRARQEAAREETPWAVRGFNRDVTGMSGRNTFGETGNQEYEALVRGGWSPIAALANVRGKR